MALTESCSSCDSAVPREVAENTEGKTQERLKSQSSREGSAGTLPVNVRHQDRHKTETRSSAAPPATFIFQTLGYVEFQDGDVRAIVADGSETYLVKQGEVFANQYQATSVDPILVLAVKVLPVKPLPDFLSMETDFGGQPASKRLYGSLKEARSSGSIDLLFMASLGQDVHASSTDLGVNLFTTLSTGLDMHSHLYTTDNPKLGY